MLYPLSPVIEAERSAILVVLYPVNSMNSERIPRISSASSPSTAIQLNLSRMLADELRAIGAADVRITDYGAVLAVVPATAEGPSVGLLAHVDTAPAYHAVGVKPVVHRGYNGGPISFADAPALVLSPEGSPYLGEKLGHDIITASGLTLLGADDKAGVAIIMTAARHLLENPQIPHGKICIAFTPDEEIELTADDCDEIEYDGSAFDLGEAVSQTLALAIDLFAEGPNADAFRAAHGLEGEAPTGPFAALAARKKD